MLGHVLYGVLYPFGTDDVSFFLLFPASLFWYWCSFGGETEERPELGAAQGGYHVGALLPAEGGSSRKQRKERRWDAEGWRVRGEGGEKEWRAGRRPSSHSRGERVG